MDVQDNLLVKITEANQDIKHILERIKSIEKILDIRQGKLNEHESQLRVIASRLDEIEEKQKDVIALKIDQKTMFVIGVLILGLIGSVLIKVI